MAKIFISYAHNDEAWRQELDVHLKGLQRQGLVETWHDRCLDVGDEVSATIAEELEQADLILLLVSPYFIASNYCYDVEMSRAMKLHEAGSARVIPVILEPTDWHDFPFGKLLATPPDGKPVSLFPNRHEAFAQVIQALKKALPRSQILNNTFQPRQSQSSPESALPRSSNLGVRRTYTDQDRDQFIVQTFEFISRFFQGSLNELESRNRGISGVLRQIDANRFTVTIYRDGIEQSACTIWLGGRSGFGDGINYYNGISLDGNTLNDSLTVGDNGYALHFESFGTASLGGGDHELTQQGAAEHLWAQFIERLQ